MTRANTPWRPSEHERACLLLAIAPEAVTVGVVERCPASVLPASVLPAWFARITPSMADCGSEAAWPAMVRRYARVVRRGATTLDDVGWRRVLAHTMLAVLAEAKPHDTSGLCARVSALWVRVLAGDEPPKEEWAAANAGTGRDRLAALWARSAAGASAKGSAIAAAWAAANADQAGRDATWDCMTTVILDSIEVECDRELKEKS